MDGISLWPELGWNGSLNIRTAEAQPTREKTAGSACPRHGLHPRRGRDNGGVRAHPAGGPVICRAKRNLVQEWGPRSDCPAIWPPLHQGCPHCGPSRNPVVAALRPLPWIWGSGPWGQ